MGWKNWPYWVKGGVIGFCIALLLFIFLSDLGRWIRNPIEDLFRSSAQSSIEYQDCINKKIQETKDLDPRPAISVYDCLSTSGEKLFGIGKAIHDIQNSFDGLFMIFGYFGFIIWFVPFILIGILVGFIIGKIKSKKDVKTKENIESF